MQKKLLLERKDKDLLQNEREETGVNSGTVTLGFRLSKQSKTTV